MGPGGGVPGAGQFGNLDTQGLQLAPGGGQTFGHRALGGMGGDDLLKPIILGPGLKTANPVAIVQPLGRVAKQGARPGQAIAEGRMAKAACKLASINR